LIAGDDAARASAAKIINFPWTYWEKMPSHLRRRRDDLVHCFPADFGEVVEFSFDCCRLSALSFQICPVSFVLLFVKGLLHG
jgi:hypothetical protein